MKFIADETFQFRGLHRTGVTLTVTEEMVRAEIDKGKHKRKSGSRRRWLSGLLEHCSPANQETANFVDKFTGDKTEPIEKKDNEKDDSIEIREIRAELDTLGIAYHPRLGVVKLRLELIKAKKATGLKKEDTKEETIIKD